MALYNMMVAVEADDRKEAYELYCQALQNQFETHDLWKDLPDDGLFGVVRVDQIYQPLEDVADFMTAAGQINPTYPTLVSEEVSNLRHKLIAEELQEYDDEVKAENIVGIADAIGDMLYVVYGAAVAHGIDIYPIFEEIHKSNMTKFIDGYPRPGDGKWMKGPSYTPANLEPIITAQIARGKAAEEAAAEANDEGNQ